MIGLIIFIALILIAAIAIAIRKPKDKGKSGERAVAKILGKNVGGKQYVINNLLFISDTNQSCQIDHILINKHGIIVIETKNYAGKIFGNETRREWTQVLANGNVKNKLYNPVKQNQTHIYHLSKYLKVNNVFVNIVVFSDKADITNVDSDRVITMSKLKGVKNCETGITLTDKQMETYYKKLFELKSSNRLTERQHVKNIRNKQKLLKKGICPRCGRKLVLRDGEYGKFYGCSNYPECKFTIDINDMP